MKAESFSNISAETLRTPNKSRTSTFLGKVLRRQSIEAVQHSTEKNSEQPRLHIEVKSGETIPMEVGLTKDLRNRIEIVSDAAHKGVKLRHAAAMSESGNLTTETKQTFINGHKVTAERYANEYGSCERLALFTDDKVHVFERGSENEYPYEYLRVYTADAKNEAIPALRESDVLVDAWAVSSSGAMYEGVSDSSELLKSLISADEMLKQIEN